MKVKPRFLMVLSLAILLSACGKDNDTATPAEPASEPTSTSVAAPEAIPAPHQAAAEPAPATATFDVNSVPMSDKKLGEFPFFTTPEGYKYTSNCQNNSSAGELNLNQVLKQYSRYYFPVGPEALYPVEGKVFRVSLFNEERKTCLDADVLLIRKNYEAALLTAGATKVYDGDVSHRKAHEVLGTNSEDKSLYSPQEPNAKRFQVYLIRKQDVEIWFEIACSSRCHFVVTQKGEMKQSVGTVPASKMKEELDKVGHIALYINFDVDKATIRPDSQDTIDEIVKLLETYPDLKIRIEGHTDNTGSAEHNATLSDNRASSVFGALLTRGIAMNRLEAKGFGMTQPIADNNTEEGRAKNRRVELVKISP